MSHKLRVAVVGAGHLGRIHARLLSQRDDVELAGIVDPVPAARDAVSREFFVPGVADFRALPKSIDAAVVAAPTEYHHDVALRLLRNDIHVLVEKPLARNVAEADDLVDAAARRQRILQVGHVERFNPAFDAIRPHLGRIRYLEAVRASGYSFRSTDIGVVLDLMIHDLDVVLSLIPEPIVEVTAFATTVVGPHEDMAQARLTFANGCVANLTASRVSCQAERTLKIYSEGAIAHVDFNGPTARILRPGAPLRDRTLQADQIPAAERNQWKDRFFQDVLPVEELAVEKRNAIADEQSDFVQAIRLRQSPRVTGLDGRRALDAAERILAQFVSPARHMPLVRHDQAHAPLAGGPHFAPAAARLSGLRKAG